ncbi:hypothetical protein CSPX01_04320 [Colletotrichum filicis]|nr:hypothetical protein CSPX01_04320 [Colletotrichum filicis]
MASFIKTEHYEPYPEISPQHPPYPIHQQNNPHNRRRLRHRRIPSPQLRPSQRRKTHPHRPHRVHPPPDSSRPPRRVPRPRILPSRGKHLFPRPRSIPLCKPRTLPRCSC